MASIHVEAGTPLAAQIQSAVQPKLMDLGWAPDENDTTLSEYITMMLVNGKDQAGVQSEIGNELLGMGEEDPVVKEFALWLFERVQTIVQPAPQIQQMQVQQESGMGQPEMPTADSAMMDDTAALTPPVDGAPSGPKAMREPSSRGRGGRGGRMLGQLNRNMDRSTDMPDSLRRIKGAASSGRINSHAAPRGSRGGGTNLANGVQRMMNGAGAGAAQQAGMMNNLGPDGQMMFMQMMEMQANMMASMLQNGQVPGAPPQQPQHIPQHASAAGQGGAGGRSLADRMDRPLRGSSTRGGRGGRGAIHHNANHSTTTPAQNGDSMDTSTDEAGDKKPPFDTPCHFNLACTNPSCKYAHQSPAAPPGTLLDLTDTCPYASACTNTKCTARHPSPAQRVSYQKSEVECKFYPNCTMGGACPFKHPDMPACRNGAECSVEGCKFGHSRIMCRYRPCLNPGCGYRHAEGQKGGGKEGGLGAGGNVWTAAGGVNGGGEGMNGGGKMERFAEFGKGQGEEELIKPEANEDGSGHVEVKVEGEGMAAVTS